MWASLSPWLAYLSIEGALARRCRAPCCGGASARAHAKADDGRVVGRFLVAGGKADRRGLYRPTDAGKLPHTSALCRPIESSGNAQARTLPCVLVCSAASALLVTSEPCASRPALLLVDSDDSVARAAAGVVSCERVARARHIRPQSEPNPRLRPPPVFWRAGRRGASRVGRWGVRWTWRGGSRLGGGAKFSIFQFSCSMAQKLDKGSDNYGKTNRTSRSGGFAEFRPIPGRLGGTGRPGDPAPWCGVRPSVHWQMRGRPSQHRERASTKTVVRINAGLQARSRCHRIILGTPMP